MKTFAIRYEQHAADDWRAYCDELNLEVSGASKEVAAANMRNLMMEVVPYEFGLGDA